MNRSTHIISRFLSSLPSRRQTNVSVFKTVNASVKFEMKKTKIQQISVPPSQTLITPIVRLHPSLQQRIIVELKHYYHGFKLLFMESQMTFRLLSQVFNGHTLARKERRQVTRTVFDLCRLVPFSVFIIVPFMEFTLPIFLKLFPNMLPSTFKQTDKDKDYWQIQSNIKLETARFLRDTSFKSSNMVIDQFIQKIRSTSAQPSVEKIMQISSPFVDKLTIKSLDRPFVIALCKLLDVPFNGPVHYLRCKLHLKLHRLKTDDRMILTEGITKLNHEDLQSACHERGMATFDLSTEQLQEQLQSWTDLRIRNRVPGVILLLIRAFYSTENQINKEQCFVPQRTTNVNDDLNKLPTFVTIEQLKHLTNNRSHQIPSKTLVVHLNQFIQTSDKRQKNTFT